MTDRPRLIRIDPTDNVAVVANDSGLPGGSEVGGLTLAEDVPQAHKVALIALQAGDPVVRCGVVIGHAARPIPAGSWVNEANLDMPPPVLEELAMPSALPIEALPLEGYSFQGFRNPDGSAGTRNILAITNTVQCVSGVVGHAVDRIRREMLPRFPNVDDPQPRLDDPLSSRRISVRFLCKQPNVQILTKVSSRSFECGELI